MLACTFLIRLDIKTNFSKITFWFAAYAFFALFNRFAQTETIDANHLSVMISNYIFPLIFLFLIDNLYFDEKDLNLLVKILMLVAVGTFIASFIQATIDPFFYKGIRATEDSIGIAYGEITRNYSIYRGMRVNNHGMAMIYLAIIFSWLYCSKKNIKHLIIVGLMIYSGFVTYCRYVWVGIFLGVVGVFYIKYRKRCILILGLISLFSILVIHLYVPQFVTSDFVEQRIMEKTYRSRIDNPVLYLTKFFPKKPFFGYGIRSTESGKFGEKRPLHSLWFDVMFRNGIIGLSLLLMFLYHIYKRGKQIYKVTGNPLFIIFVLIYIIINFTASFTELDFYGYYFILLLLAMNYQLYVVNSRKQSNRNTSKLKKLTPHLPNIV